MKMTKPGRMRSLRDIRLEKEKFRYMMLRTELGFSKQLRQTRKLFTFPSIFNQTQHFLAGYIRKTIFGWFK
jgi:hypothetical protein